MPDTLTRDDIGRMLRAAAEKVRARQQELSKLDSAKNEVIVPTAQERQAFIAAAEPVIARHRSGFDPRILAWLS